jgi:hypothetical protein
MGPFESFDLSINHLTTAPLSYQVDWCTVNYTPGDSPVETRGSLVINVDDPTRTRGRMLRALILQVLEEL